MKKLLLAMFAAVLFSGTAQAERYVMVTHGEGKDPFWPVVQKGGEDAARAIGADFEYIFTPSGDMSDMAKSIAAAAATPATTRSGLLLLASNKCKAPLRTRRSSKCGGSCISFFPTCKLHSRDGVLESPNTLALAHFCLSASQASALVRLLFQLFLSLLSASALVHLLFQLFLSLFSPSPGLSRSRWSVF